MHHDDSLIKMDTFGLLFFFGINSILIPGYGDKHMGSFIYRPNKEMLKENDELYD